MSKPKAPAPAPQRPLQEGEMVILRALHQISEDQKAGFAEMRTAMAALSASQEATSGQVGMLLAALEEEDTPPERTLEGDPAGQERDQGKSLG